MGGGLAINFAGVYPNVRHAESSAPGAAKGLVEVARKESFHVLKEKPAR